MTSRHQNTNSREAARRTTRTVALERMKKAQFRVAAKHIVIFSVTSILCFNDVFYQFSIYFGAKSLSNVDAVDSTKKALLYSSISKVLSAFIVGYFGFTRNRRQVMLFSHSICMIIYSIICVSFFLENLVISRFCLIIAPVTTVGIFSVNYIYANDVCSPSLFAVNHFLVRGIPAVYGLILPLFLRFEELSYKQVGFRLLFLVGLGWVSFGWLYWNMLETRELLKQEIYKRLGLMKQDTEEDDAIMVDGL